MKVFASVDKDMNFFVNAEKAGKTKTFSFGETSSKGVGDVDADSKDALAVPDGVYMTKIEQHMYQTVGMDNSGNLWTWGSGMICKYDDF